MNSPEYMHDWTPSDYSHQHLTVVAILLDVSPCPLTIWVRVRSILSWTRLSWFLDTRTHSVLVDPSDLDLQVQRIYLAVNWTSWKARRPDPLGTFKTSCLRMPDSFSPGTPRNSTPKKRRMLICTPESLRIQPHQLCTLPPSGPPARQPSSAKSKKS